MNPQTGFSFFLHTNIEPYIFASYDDSRRVSCDQLCAQVPKYPDLLSIKHVSNIQIGATNRCIDPAVDPSVDPAGMSLQEPFTGIDDDKNSTEAWKLRRLSIWREKKKIL